MAYERMGDNPLDYAPCRYANSKLMFRGPRRRLKGDYAAFLGGTDTYGKFIEEPFPRLVEKQIGLKCVNFGWPNAGVDVFFNDPSILQAANNARVTVLQMPSTQNMSNRFYSVHPRRNDRFLEASGLLRTIYQDVDFTEFHFTRHMLTHLHAVSPDRFEMLRRELQTAWVSRMQLLLDRIDSKVILLWFSSRTPEQANSSIDVADDPAFITREMIETLRPLAAQVAEVAASDAALSEGTKGMIFSQMEAPAAAELLGLPAHREAADVLSPMIANLVG